MNDFKEIVYIAPELHALASTKYRPSTHKNERSFLVSTMTQLHLLSEKKRWLYSIIKHYSEKKEWKSQENEKQRQHHGLLSVARQSHLLCSSFSGFCSLVSLSGFAALSSFLISASTPTFSVIFGLQDRDLHNHMDISLKPVILGFDKLVVSRKHVILVAQGQKQLNKISPDSQHLLSKTGQQQWAQTIPATGTAAHLLHHN